MNTPTLKIGPLPDKTPIKLNIAIEPELKNQLELYSQIYERAYGDKQPISSLIPSMLASFLSGDPGFKKACKALPKTT